MNLGASQITELSTAFAILDGSEKIKFSLFLIFGAIFGFLEVASIMSLAPIIFFLSQEISAYSSLSDDAVFFGVSLPLYTIICAPPVLFSIKAAFGWLFISKSRRFLFGLRASISARLFGLYLNRPVSVLYENTLAGITRTISGEVSMVVNYGYVAFFNLIVELVILILALLVLGFWMPFASFAILVGGFFVGLPLWYASKRILKLSGTMRKNADSQIATLIKDSVVCFKSIFLLGKQPEFVKRFREASEMSNMMMAREQAFQSFPKLVLELLVVAVLFGGFGFLVIFADYKNTFLEGLVGFGIASFRILPALSRCLGSVQNMRFAGPAVEHLTNEFRAMEENRRSFNRFGDGERAVAEGRAWIAAPLGVAVKGLTYTYVNNAGLDQQIFKNVSLNFNPGSITGLTGASGLGKSTFIKIIAGLACDHGKSSGTVKFYHKNRTHTLRNGELALVDQDFPLLDATVAENIGLGVKFELIDLDYVEYLLGLVELQGFLKLTTMLHADGSDLSGGQKQRLSLARALYARPRILLLDEFTSSLDSLTEAKLLELVKALAPNFTVIMASHREAPLAICDTVYHLKDNRFTLIE